MREIPLVLRSLLLPAGILDEDTAAVIPEKDAAVLVYCRSKTASSALVDLGCTNIYEFGGIKTGPYETEPQNGGETAALCQTGCSGCLRNTTWFSADSFP